MTKIIIFGRCYGLLSMTLDSLHNIYGKDIYVDIVSNVTPDSTEPFLIDDMPSIHEYMHDIYDYSTISSNIIMGVGSPISKKMVYEFFKQNYMIDIQQYCNIIPYNHLHISKMVSIKNGCHVGYGTTIAPYAKIGNLVTINRNCSIGHHTIIGDFVTLSPGVNIAGNCIIGNGTKIGIGANISNNITIGENCVIGSGALVTKNVPSNTVWYGVPAKFIRNNEIMSYNSL